MGSRKNLHVETLMVHEGAMRTNLGEMSEGLFLTQGFTYPSAEKCEARFNETDPGFIYARFSNPTVAMFEARMAALEGAEAALATASGMAAVTAGLMGLVRAGDHVVSARAVFSSCSWVIEQWLPRFGVETTLVDGTDLNQWRQAVRPQTRAFFLETPANPTLDVIDIAAVADIARASNIRLVVDNVFATPLYQKPFELGADVVIYSATKHIDGQGRCLGGVILSSQQIMDEHYLALMRQTGPCMSPFNAWVLLKGLETLPLRVRQQTQTAARLADALAGHPRVRRLVYPGRADHPQAEIISRQMSGGSSLIALEIAGDRAATYRFINALEIFRISNNLGDAKSIVSHPATSTHHRLTPEQRLEIGISEGLVRLSIGLEHADDLLEDCLSALKAV